jgi:rSAM/selenodomain-associated transferase 1
VIDVVLPVLNEAQALPWVLGRLPTGYRAIVVDNGSTDGSGAIAAELGAQVVHEPRPGFGSACFAGLTAATADVVCFVDADGSLDPRDLPTVADPVSAGRFDLVLGARRPERGAWPWHARLANRALALEMRRRGARPVLRDIGPMRAARRQDLLDLDLRDRRFGWPLEMVVRAGRAGWRIHEVEVPYAARRGGRSKVTGTVRGTARTIRDMSRVLAEDRAQGASPGGRASVAASATPVAPSPTYIVIAKAPMAGRSKTRLCPPCTPQQAADLAEAALRDTLAAVLAAPAGRRVVVLEGEPGPWLPEGFEVLPQRGDGLDERLAAAFEDVAADASGGAVLVGMDTPQVAAEDLAAAWAALRADGTDAVLGHAPDGGYWSIGLRVQDPALFVGLPMSTEHTGAAQEARLRSHGRAVSLLPELRDVDLIADAEAVAALAPESRFARALERTR